MNYTHLVVLLGIIVTASSPIYISKHGGTDPVPEKQYIKDYVNEVRKPREVDENERMISAPHPQIPRIPELKRYEKMRIYSEMVYAHAEAERFAELKYPINDEDFRDSKLKPEEIDKLVNNHSEYLHKQLFRELANLSRKYELSLSELHIIAGENEDCTWGIIENQWPYKDFKDPR
jgi:hypothetical protein